MFAEPFPGDPLGPVRTVVANCLAPYIDDGSIALSQELNNLICAEARLDEVIRVKDDRVLGWPVDTVYTVTMTPLKFGIGASSEIGHNLRQMGVGRVLIVTDKTVNEKTDIGERVKDVIRGSGIETDVWDGVKAEPSRPCIEAGIEFAEGGDHDAVIGLGGGSSIDAAKSINLFTTYPADFRDYVRPPVGEGKRVPGPLKPLIAVPTTAGTGSETTSTSVVDFPELRMKGPIIDEKLRPTLAVLDPLNTITLPPFSTMSTGMDALIHAIEAYTSRSYKTKVNPRTPLERPMYGGANPVTDLFAEEAIRLIGSSLRRAVMNGNDLEARSNMHLAAYLSGVAFSNAGLHLMHALSYPIGGRMKVPHGIAVGITGPAVLELNASSLPEKHARIAELLGEEVSEKATLKAARRSSRALERLMKDIGFPNGLESIGFRRGYITEVAEYATSIRRLVENNSRLVSTETLRIILDNAMSYW